MQVVFDPERGMSISATGMFVERKIASQASRIRAAIDRADTTKDIAKVAVTMTGIMRSVGRKEAKSKENK